MKVLDPGHLYELSNLDDESGPSGLDMDPGMLRFVKRIGEKFPGNRRPGYQGTTTQEVIRALIDRMKYVDAQRPHPTNASVIAYLRAALIQLEIRAAWERDDIRAAAKVSGLETPETEPACAGCGHLFCTRQHDPTGGGA